jgi:hypothetical protein
VTTAAWGTQWLGSQGQSCRQTAWNGWQNKLKVTSLKIGAPTKPLNCLYLACWRAPYKGLIIINHHHHQYSICPH